MALSSVTALKYNLGVDQADTSRDALLTQALNGADAAVKRFCKRDLEDAVYTEYYSGHGMRDLVLRQWPVLTFTLTGTTIVSSTTVSGISSTANLIAGMPVVGTGIASGTTIDTVASATSVTLSAAATASGTVSLLFGLAVYLDSGGYYGQASGAFASTTEQVNASAFVLVYDESGKSNRGLLRRLGGTGGSSWYPPEQGEVASGGLTWRRASVWPVGTGNVKVVYYAGFATVPEDLESAVLMYAAILADQAASGTNYNSESLGDYSYTAPIDFPGRPADLASIRQILTRFRDVSM